MHTGDGEEVSVVRTLGCCAIFMAKVILIADDDENDLVATSQTLRDAGVKSLLMSVSDGEDVIAYFKGDNQYADREKYPIPDVLLLDLKMRRTGGFQVLEWLKKHAKTDSTIVIVLSAHGELENVRNAYALGARSFLTKPCHLEDVRNLIEVYPTYWEVDTPKKSITNPGNDYASGQTFADPSP